MRKFGVVSIMFVGFVAGIIFVYSCGGGGSIVLAEITDVTGLEAGLDAINSSIQGIDATTDMTGLEGNLNSLNSVISGIMNGVESRLEQIDSSLQEIKMVSQNNVQTQSITIFSDEIISPCDSLISYSIPIEGYNQLRILGVTDNSSAEIRIATVIGSVQSGWSSPGLGWTNGSIINTGILGESMIVRLGMPCAASGNSTISLAIQLAE